MVPRLDSDDPILEVSASGTANLDGEYLQHDAVLPHKSHAVALDPATVVVRRDSTAPSSSNNTESEGEAGGDTLQDVATIPEETTEVTKSKMRAKGWALYRTLAYVEEHRLTTLAFALGGLFLLVAGLIAVR
jgi:hypothetical protein